MPSSPGRSPAVAADASESIALYTDTPTPHRLELPIRSPPNPHKRPPPSPSPALALPTPKKTRYHPDLTLCHACKRRTTPGKPLRPLPSQWRVALLCPSCFLAIRAGESCSYCFARFGGAALPAGGLVHCRRCRSPVHLACIPRMRGFASLPHDLDPHLFTCVDCAAVPGFLRAGVSAVNKVSVDRAERAFRFVAAEKAEEAAKARSRACRKAEAAACAVVLARELFVPGEDCNVAPPMEIDRPSVIGDAEEIQETDIIKQLGYGDNPPGPQKPPLLTYLRRKGNLARSRGKLLFMVTYSLKRKNAAATDNVGTPAAKGQERCDLDDKFQGEFDHKESGVPDLLPDQYSKSNCRKSKSEMSPEVKELDENRHDKKGYAGCTHLASHTKHCYLKTYLRGYKLVSSDDERKAVKIQCEQKQEPHSAASHEARHMPNRYLKKYCRRLVSNGVDDGSKASSLPEYSRKIMLETNVEEEQVAPDNGLGNHWRLHRCTASGNVDAPEELGGLALDAANDNLSSGSLSMNEKL